MSFMGRSEREAQDVAGSLEGAHGSPEPTDSLLVLLLHLSQCQLVKDITLHPLLSSPCPSLSLHLSRLASPVTCDSIEGMSGGERRVLWCG